MSHHPDCTASRDARPLQRSQDPDSVSLQRRQLQLGNTAALSLNGHTQPASVQDSAEVTPRWVPPWQQLQGEKAFLMGEDNVRWSQSTGYSLHGERRLQQEGGTDMGAKIDDTDSSFTEGAASGTRGPNTEASSNGSFYHLSDVVWHHAFFARILSTPPYQWNTCDKL